MIIECRNCLKRFVVRDSDITTKGRVVKCGNCSTQWRQMPTSPPIKRTKIIDNEKISPKVKRSLKKDNLNEGVDLLNKELKASDGKNYKFLGNQWAQILPTGKAGKLAKKAISNELNKLANRKTYQKKKVKILPEDISNQYQEKQKGIGLFSFLIVLFMFIAAILLFLDTFKSQITPFWPNLDNYLVYIFETLNNIYIIIKDLFNNYK